LVSEFPRGKGGSGSRMGNSCRTEQPARLRNIDLGERIASGIKAVLAADRRDSTANGCEGGGDVEE